MFVITKSVRDTGCRMNLTLGEVGSPILLFSLLFSFSCQRALQLSLTAAESKGPLTPLKLVPEA